MGEFSSSFLGSKTPSDGSCGEIAGSDIGEDFVLQGEFIGDALREAPVGQDGEFDFGDIEPTAVEGG